MKRRTFRHGAALSALAIGAGLFAAPAFAQSTTAPDDQTTLPAPAPIEAAAQPVGEDIVVTGSILRQTTTQTPSPVTVLTAESLDQRGINTTQDAI